mgnify:CR=1 FL=1
MTEFKIKKIKGQERKLGIKKQILTKKPIIPFTCNWLAILGFRKERKEKKLSKRYMEKGMNEKEKERMRKVLENKNLAPKLICKSWTSFSSF